MSLTGVPCLLVAVVVYSRGGSVHGWQSAVSAFLMSRAARDTGQRLSRAARERPGAWWWDPHAGVKRARAFAI